MKLITFLNLQNDERLGMMIDGQIIDLQLAAREIVSDLPTNILDFLQGGASTLKIAADIEKAYRKGLILPVANQTDMQLLSPVPHPPSTRDGYAFRQHVETARRNRGVPMIPEFDQFPVFYFTNHNSIIGEGVLAVEDDHLQKLDFELEVAAVIGKRGRNIEAKDADSYIFGYTIMNDFSARVLQMEEMQLSLGPAKGKDFATALGPWLVSSDELESYKIATPNGDKYNLEMKAFHNGKQVSSGNMKDMNWTFAEIIERASYGVDLYPGDVIGSGTVGTGCYLELNGTATIKAKEKGESYTPVWLKDGDTIELEISGLGRLKNTVAKRPKHNSILEKKKNVV